MNELSNFIFNTSQSFLEEARNSLLLIEDMAAMENYMAESYSGRVFIELLQNADDCFSSKVGLFKIGNNIYFANNGEPFRKNDILAICRTGASIKKRGEKIGYRGVGFKSTTSISNEIIIFSSEVFFSFSKSLAAQHLGLSINKVPTVRIPFLVNNMDESVKEEIECVISKGYNTVFAFLNANIDKLEEEVKELTTDVFIFLNSITCCEICIQSLQKNYFIDRIKHDDYEECCIENKKWKVIKSNNTSVAFLEESDHITNCSDAESVYHCFLPTLDKSPFPIKINADFSTDPSRKHLSLDKNTEKSLAEVEDLLCCLVSDSLNNIKILDSHLLSLLCIRKGFSSINLKMINDLKLKLCNISVRLSSGDQVLLSDYKMLPDWLEESEKESIRRYSSLISKESLPRSVYESIFQVDKFISYYSQKEFSNDELLCLLEDVELLKKLTDETIVKISSRIIKKAHLDNRIYGKKVNLDKAIESINLAKKAEDSEVFSKVVDSLNDSDLEFINDYSEVEIKRPQIQTPISSYIPSKSNDDRSVYSSKKPTVTKWRSAEKQVIELEQFFGNKAEDLSRMNVGYDIESVTPEGEKRYIEVKAIKGDYGEFSITNNEYTAAHQYGEQYYICLVFDKKAIYIKNPLENLSFVKRIRQWEWVCDKYSGEEIEFNS